MKNNPPPSLPREMLGFAATFVHGIPEEAAIAKLSLSRDDIRALLQRDDIQTKFREQTVNAIAADE